MSTDMQLPEVRHLLVFPGFLTLLKGKKDSKGIAPRTIASVTRCESGERFRRFSVIMLVFLHLVRHPRIERGTH